MNPLWEASERLMAAALRPDCTLSFRFLECSGNFTRSLYAEHLNSVLMVEAAIQAEAEGFDGIYLACWNDPLLQAREMVGIPVASVSEQSMLAALTMGRRFAVVTVSEKTAVAIESDLLAYGLGGRAIVRPVRALAPESDAGLLLQSVINPWTDFIPRFEHVARACIADGADVILVGCAYYGPLLRKAGYSWVEGTGVPVIDSTTVGLKALEAMVDTAALTGVVKSQQVQFRAPPADAIARCRAAFRLPD